MARAYDSAPSGMIEQMARFSSIDRPSSTLLEFG
jgi:hypothetical protein